MLRADGGRRVLEVSGVLFLLPGRLLADILTQRVDCIEDGKGFVDYKSGKRGSYKIGLEWPELDSGIVSLAIVIQGQRRQLQ